MVDSAPRAGTPRFSPPAGVYVSLPLFLFAILVAFLPSVDVWMIATMLPFGVYALWRLVEAVERIERRLDAMSRATVEEAEPDVPSLRPQG